MKASPSSSAASSPEPVVAQGVRIATTPAETIVPVQLKFQKILVPIDFSEHSRKALSCALGFAAERGAELTLIHVVEPVIYPTDWMVPLPNSDFADVRAILVDKLKMLTTNQASVTETIVKQGVPWQEIVDAAKVRDADLIVIGTHGYSGLQHAFMGSVAERVVRFAPCPVLTIRLNARELSEL